ncbi:hypothetical protein [Acidithiobacillus marinus]|nr:hypothetical protein [Acidithiobacillus marinus]
MLLSHTVRFCEKIQVRRSPDQVIGGASHPYLLRWFLLPKNRYFNVYLHVFLRSDDDRAMHDHPWHNMSYLVHGAYIEHRQSIGGLDSDQLQRPGSIVFRKATQAHRIELIDDAPCTSLFFTGPKIREWGFYTPQGWVHWRDFLDNPNA